MMKIAISNLAWSIAEDTSVAQILQALEIKGVEIAPTKIWKNPLQTSPDEINAYKTFWQRQGIQIVAMQSLLFGRPDLTLFREPEKRRETFDYLSSLIKLGNQLGAEILVFGSPKNRQRGSLTFSEAEAISLSFFSELGKVAKDYDVKFCLEPNPQVYECDFITNAQQGYELVTKINHQGLGLHLDAAGMTLSNEDIKLMLEKTIDKLCHFHISEINLEIITEGDVNHQLFGKSLARLNYSGWKSIEMRAKNTVDDLVNITKALEIAIKYYSNFS